MALAVVGNLEHVSSWDELSARSTSFRCRSEPRDEPATGRVTSHALRTANSAWPRRRAARSSLRWRVARPVTVAGAAFICDQERADHLRLTTKWK